MNKPAQPAPQADPRTPSDMLVNGGALTLALNVLRRAGKDEVADELEKTAVSARPAPSDEEIIDMAVEPLGIDYDRMPYGIVAFVRALLSRYAVLVKYPALDTEQTTEAEWFECEGQVFHKDSPDMNDWIRWKGTPLHRHPAYAQALRKKNKELWDALSIAKNTITDARNDLIACHSIKGVIPADDVEGLARVVEYDSILKPINAALSEIPEVPATHVVAQEQPDIQLQLKDPVVVHTNMCRGIIAPITFDMLAHVLGDDAKQEWLAAQAQQVDLIRFDYVNADGQPDSKMLTHDEMRERYAEQSQNAYQSPAASQQPVSGERPCLLDALSAIEWLERRVPQSYKNSEGNVACVVNAKESLRRLLATPPVSRECCTGDVCPNALCRNATSMRNHC